jgi:hypothetical protein
MGAGRFFYWVRTMAKARNGKAVRRPRQGTSRLVWGARAIAEIIGTTERQAFNALEAGALPGCRKNGGRWCMDREAFFASFREAAE